MRNLRSDCLQCGRGLHLLLEVAGRRKGVGSGDTGGRPSAVRLPVRTRPHAPPRLAHEDLRHLLAEAWRRRDPHSDVRKVLAHGPRNHGASGFEHLLTRRWRTAISRARWPRARWRTPPSAHGRSQAGASSWAATTSRTKKTLVTRWWAERLGCRDLTEMLGPAQGRRVKPRVTRDRRASAFHRSRKGAMKQGQRREAPRPGDRYGE